MQKWRQHLFTYIIITINHNDVTKYVKSHFKNMLENQIKSIEKSIRSNIKKQYKLKNPILSEYCIIV